MYIQSNLMMKNNNFSKCTQLHELTLLINWLFFVYKYINFPKYTYWHLFVECVSLVILLMS